MASALHCLVTYIFYCFIHFFLLKDDYSPPNDYDNFHDLEIPNRHTIGVKTFASDGTTLLDYLVIGVFTENDLNRYHD
jgi:hypothetical protein